YYTAPEKQGVKAYALLLQSLIKSKKAAIGRFVLRNTENLCVIHPLDDVIVISKIRFEEEIRKRDDLKKADDVKVSKKELDMGLALIKQYSSDFEITGFKDEYSNELLRIIKAQARGKPATVKTLKPKQAESHDRYDQLMESLNSKKGAEVLLLQPLITFFISMPFFKTRLKISPLALTRP